MKKFFSLVLALVIALSLTTVAWADSTDSCTDPCAHEAAIGTTHYDTLAEAVANGGTVTLLSDVTLTESISIAAGKTVVLDLAGFTITGTDTATGNFGLININPGADLTINDSVGTGAITLSATTDRDWNSYSSVISNQRGKLTVNGGTIEHKGGTDMAYGIDNLTNGKDTYAETIINGGTVKSTYRAIRQFLNGVEAQNILTINGGTIEGTNKSIWMQDPNTNANSGTLTVSEDATLKGDVYLFVTAGSTEWPVTVSIASDALSGDSTVLSANVPTGYEVKTAGDYWGVADVSVTTPSVASVKGVYYATLQTAINAGGTVTLLDNVTLTQTVTVTGNVVLDLNGKTITNNTTAPITVDGGTLTVKDSSADQTGAVVAASTSSNNNDKAAILFTSNSGKFVLESGTLKSTKYGIRSTTGTSEIVINGGTIDAAEYGVISFTDTVTLSGGTINSGIYGVAAYGNFTMNGGTINAQAGYVSAGTRDYTVAVFNGGTINASIYDGIYWPSAGSLTINGGSITGACGVYVKSGTVAVTGGTITATGAKDDYAYVDSGSVVTGDALVIENVGNNGYEAVSSVSITGGTFTSANASAVASYAATTENPNAVAVTGFIEGGTFAGAVPAEYCAAGYVPVIKNGVYTVDKASDVVAVVDGVNYTSLQEAVNAVADGGTIVVMKSGLSATVNEAKTFTVEYAEGVTGAEIIPTTGYTGTIENGKYTITKVNSGYSPYNPNPSTKPATKPVQSAETFDAGIAMYVGMSVLAATGSAVVLKKKED